MMFVYAKQREEMALLGRLHSNKGVLNDKGRESASIVRPSRHIAKLEKRFIQNNKGSRQ